MSWFMRMLESAAGPTHVRYQSESEASWAGFFGSLIRTIFAIIALVVIFKMFVAAEADDYAKATFYGVLYLMLRGKS